MVRYLWRLMPMIGDDPSQVAVPSAPKPRTPPPMTLNAPSAAASSPFGAIRGGGATAVAEPPRPARSGGDDVIRQVKREEPKVGRNDPCHVRQWQEIQEVPRGQRVTRVPGVLRVLGVL